MLEGNGGGLRVYRDSLGSVHPLDREAERKLAKQWLKGDERAGLGLGAESGAAA